MTEYFENDRVSLYHGDCIEVMRSLPDNSVDAVVTDPPYGLEFMGKDWDAPWKQAGDVIADPASVGGFQDGAGGNPFSRSRIRYGREDGASVGFQLWFTEVATEALRILKPGGHLLAFGGTRTWHRLAVAIEDAGFEIRDNIARLHGDNRLCHCEFPDVIEWSYGTGEPQTEHDLRFVQHADLPPTVNAENKRGEVLQSEMSEHGTQSTSGLQSEKGFENGEESGMEGRDNLQTTEGQLFGSEIRQGAGVGKTDGAQGRLHNGAPFSDGENVRIFTDSHGSGESHRSQPIKQQSGELGAVSNERRSQARGSWPFCVRCGKPLGATESTHLAWVMGSGFPKSLDVSKAIDKRAGAEREVIGERKQRANSDNSAVPMNASAGVVELITAPATPAAQQWQGWGTALKPAFEPIVVARKPLIGTVAENVLTHGTGALNIDGCRIGTEQRVNSPASSLGNSVNMSGGMAQNNRAVTTATGRWPANVILDESQAAELDRQSGVLTSGANPTRRNSDKFRDAYGDFVGQTECVPARGADTGGASRFFYVAKAGKKERPNVDGVAHPTVKPLALMQYLVRLVTPANGTVLEPFAGSGTTIEAALNEGFNVIGIEMTDEYLPLILARIERYGEKLC